jgi:exosortase H (IPTLxxWG-CTERM-specific)
MRRFTGVFPILLLALFALQLWQPVQHFAVEPWTAALAWVSAGLMSGFDADVSAAGRIIRSHATGFAIAIEAGCNGVEAALVLVAAILAWSATWRQRLIGIAAGLTAIQALNVVRVISLFYLGQWREDVFQWAHLYVWQMLIMLDAMIVWLLWHNWIRRDATPKSARQAAAARS